MNRLLAAKVCRNKGMNTAIWKSNRLREIRGIFQTGGSTLNRWEKLHFDGGLKDFVAWVNRDKGPMHEPIYVSKQVCNLKLLAANPSQNRVYGNACGVLTPT